MRKATIFYRHHYLIIDGSRLKFLHNENDLKINAADRKLFLKSDQRDNNH